MLLLPNYVKIKKYTKHIFNRYDIFYFDANYKKRKNKKQNYLLQLDCLVTSEELNDFIKWVENDLDNGTKSFFSDFEILRPEIEIIDDFEYKFYEMYKYSKAEGDYYNLTLNFVRIVAACPIVALNIYNALLDFKKILKGENVGYEAHVSCPLIFQKIGISLMNFQSMTEEHANDYIPTRIFK